MTAITGLLGTGDWATDERPKNWRETILYLYPNGDAPLTAILSKTRSEMVDDPEFNWWTKNLPSQGGALTNIYTDAALSSAYTSGGVAGDVLYVKLAEAVAEEFRAGHQVLLRDSSHLDVDVNAKCTNVTKNGANSYLTVSLLEADDNGASTDLSDADRVLIIGSINPEGGAMPDGILYQPVKYYNYTQIFRTPMSITRTARKTKLRTKPAYQEAKRETLEMHSIEMEKAFIHGIKTENTGANGKPERTTQGIISFIKENASANVDDFSLNSDYSGQTWLQGGEDWLEEQLEQNFRYGSNHKLAFCGSGTILGINRLAKTGGQIQLQPRTRAYGIQVMEWVTPFGTIDLKRHPLFSYESTTRNSMLIMEPAMCKYRYIDDTHFIADDMRHGANRRDGTDEEWLSECGLELHHPLKFGYLSGFNTANSV